MQRAIIPIVLVLVTAIAACGGPRVQILDDVRQPGVRGVVPDTGYAVGPATRGGTGRYYMGRQIAQVMGHEGAAWLERPERSSTEMPDYVVEALGLASDDHVADIGAGTGYFTIRLARQVPAGVVYAVDVQPEMLAILEARLAQEGVRNVHLVLGEEHDPNLPDGSLDLVLIVDAYHEFAYPREMLANIRRALLPGGRLVMIEYRSEDEELAIHPLHRMSEVQVRREVEASGLRWVETRDFLPFQHFLVFGR
jgi:SAM-dependent methyltransferase